MATGNVEGGSMARGDGASTPSGMHLACIPGRRFALDVTLRNRSATPVTLTSAALDPPSDLFIRRVAVQFRLASPPPKGDLYVSGLRRWSRSAPKPTTIPSGRSAWVQSNFLMGNCSLLLPGQSLVANRTITVAYRADGKTASQQIATPGARIVLAR
jgi:hypothetical protein